MAKRRKHGGGRRRAATGATAPERTCVACRKTGPKEGLLRFVRAPDGGVAFDVRAKVDGRGAWTCPDADCVARAVERGGFARAFSAPVLVDGDLVATVTEVLEREVLNAISLLRRQAQAFAGRSEALRRLHAGEADRLVVAHDLSARSVAELRESMESTAELVFGPGKDAIGRVLGRGATGVVGLAGGSMCRRVVSDLTRWGGLSRLPGDPAKRAALRSQMSGV